VSFPGRQQTQRGLTYVEVLIAALLIVMALVPATNSLYSGLLASRVATNSSEQHYAVLSLSETVLAEPYSALLAAAAVAGDETTPTSFSDAAGIPERRVVFIARYDADDSDSDGDPFSVPDPDADGDGNPYTGYDGLLWVSVEVEGSIIALRTLAAK
jgi:hypothetical protein